MSQSVLIGRILPTKNRVSGKSVASVTGRRNGLEIEGTATGSHTSTSRGPILPRENLPVDDTIFELEDGANFEIRKLEGGGNFRPFEAVDKPGFQIFVDDGDFEISEAMDEALQFSTQRACVGEPKPFTATGPPAPPPSSESLRAVAVERPASRSTGRSTDQSAGEPTSAPGRGDGTAPRQPTVDHKAVLKPGQREYKCVWLMEKFSPKRVSRYMNQMAAEGWRVIAVTTADRPTRFGRLWGRVHQEIVLVLERKVTTETTASTRPEAIPDKA
jgi:hypothetical protein